MDTFAVLSSRIGVSVEKITFLEVKKSLISYLKDLSDFTNCYSSSGCCPSCASHLHSVISIFVKVALKEESSGLQA